MVNNEKRVLKKLIEISIKMSPDQMGTGDRSIESNHISSLTRVERDPYHGHSYKPKPSFMLLILKP
jgi:hypothetical protein